MFLWQVLPFVSTWYFLLRHLMIFDNIFCQKIWMINNHHLFLTDLPISIPLQYINNIGFQQLGGNFNTFVFQIRSFEVCGILWPWLAAYWSILFFKEAIHLCDNQKNFSHRWYIWYSVIYSHNMNKSWDSVLWTKWNRNDSVLFF